MADSKEKKWEQVQIKAFKSWVNSTLEKQNIAPIEKIDRDLQDGVRLLIFLENVCGKKVGKYDHNPRSRIQMIQNLNLAVQFIQNELGVRLVGISAEDICDGNLKLILGLLWSLFRKLRIEQVVSSEGQKIEDGLLLWVQKMTEGYNGVHIENFKHSFNDGLAFSALVNRFNPELLDFANINSDDKEANLERAFDIAEKQLGIPKLLDTADLVNGTPDERSVTLYVSLFFHAFVASEERRKIEASKNVITDKLTALQNSLTDVESERDEIIERNRSLKKKQDELEELLRLKEEKQNETDEKVRLLDEELSFSRERSIHDAESINLLEQKICCLEELLESEVSERNKTNENRQRLQAELEELKARQKQLAVENESLEEMRKRLLTENEKRDGLLADLENRKSLLQKELEQLRKNVENEIERRRNAAQEVLRLKNEVENLRKRQIVQGKARGGLDILRINLEEHLEDMYRWRELHEYVLEEDRHIFDLDKVMADIKDKTFEEQLEYLDDQLQAENKSLLRIIRLKDSQFKLKDIELKKGFLFMKGRKDWKRRWFSLKGQALHYYENESSERCEGFVDLTKGCDVVRQKAVKEEDSVKKQWPLKITVGDRKLFVRAASKKERHSWYLFLASKIAHINYLKACETTGARPDTRLITLFSSENIPNLFLDNRPLNDDSAAALARVLPAHDETETLSLCNTNLNDSSVKPIAEVLEKLGIKTLSLNNNKIASEGALLLAQGIKTNNSLTELNLENNLIDDRGVIEIASAIAAKPAITMLNLSGNKIATEGVKALVESLSGTRTLPDLLLARNSIDDEAASSLATIFTSNPTITNVNLSGNHISDSGSASIAKALSTNTSVLNLDLSNNNIGTNGALAFESLLKINPCLNNVNLSGNKKILGGAEIASLLREGFCFPSLSLSRLHPTHA
eukprot:TRINITY_DN128_c1_g3_i1.p1 TRINITY_DN128_c1_g3~~TRINITY_DN128_c1_g3_i1.p1  ORF type:complete len:922 (-),score=520.52 TRINITY_DN128_c1_g3_i1:182-2947(-)